VFLAPAQKAASPIQRIIPSTSMAQLLGLHSAARYLGEQRCESCGVFCRLVGPGGECPHCGELVAVEDLGLPTTARR